MVELKEKREEIAVKMISARKDLKITQLELSKSSTVGIATIKRFESGKYWINIKQFLLLKNALKIQDFII